MHRVTMRVSLALERRITRTAPARSRQRVALNGPIITISSTTIIITIPTVKTITILQWGVGRDLTRLNLIGVEVCALGCGLGPLSCATWPRTEKARKLFLFL